MSHCYDYPRPAVTTDVVLLRLRQGQLQLLLIQRANPPHAGAWALPGGFLEMDEELATCARRELAEETGIRQVHLEQLHTFGQPDRDPRGRVISVVYLALARADQPTEPRADSDAAAVRWFPLADLPPLAFDHPRIVKLARERLSAGLDQGRMAARLLPERFTLDELQGLYEQVQDRHLDSGHFRAQTLAAGLIEPTGRQRHADGQPDADEYRMKHPPRVEMAK